MSTGANEKISTRVGWGLAAYLPLSLDTDKLVKETEEVARP